MSLPSFTWSFAAASEAATAAPGHITPGVDWALQADGDIEFPLRFTTGTEAVAQGVQVRLGDIKGENFLDQSLGVPWSEIVGQKPNLPRTRAILRKVIAAAPGVSRIESMVATFDPRARRLAVTADIRTTDDLLLTMGVAT